MGAMTRLILERSLLVGVYMYILEATVHLQPFPSTVSLGAYL